MVLLSVEDFKAPGIDGIYPAMLEDGIEHLEQLLRNIFGGYLALGYVPSSWQKVKVVLIPKPGKDEYSNPKNFSQINLKSFSLKCLVGRHIHENTFTSHPLNENQHAYQCGKFCESALHCLASKIEHATPKGEYAMGVFVDIEGAFDCAPFQNLYDAASEHGVDEILIERIYAMLTRRLLCAEVSVDRYLTTEAAKGCHEGDVLLPLLWSMLIDSLLCELESLSIHAQAKADDVAVLVVDRDLGTVCRNIERAVDLIDSWCKI